MVRAGVRRHQQRIAALREALQQMGDGACGICPRSHAGIEFVRLEAAPEVRLCLRCSGAV